MSVLRRSLRPNVRFETEHYFDYYCYYYCHDDDCVQLLVHDYCQRRKLEQVRHQFQTCRREQQRIAGRASQPGRRRCRRYRLYCYLSLWWCDDDVVQFRSESKARWVQIESIEWLCSLGAQACLYLQWQWQRQRKSLKLTHFASFSLVSRTFKPTPTNKYPEWINTFDRKVFNDQHNQWS